ncbi:MAG: SdpI family protein [Haloechinothrix sp.]
MIVVALIPILGGILVGLGGFLGWRGRLSRSRAAGVRTAATMRSDEAFGLANKVAGTPTMAAGAVGIVAGVAALLMPTALGTVLAATIGVLGLVLLVGAGGLLGHRAALTVPEPVAAAGCGGCACGSGGCGS